MIPNLMLSSQLAERHCGLVGTMRLCDLCPCACAWLGLLAWLKLDSWAGVKHRRPMAFVHRLRGSLWLGLCFVLFVHRSSFIVPCSSSFPRGGLLALGCLGLPWALIPGPRLTSDLCWLGSLPDPRPEPASASNLRSSFVCHPALVHDRDRVL